jgi:hypothetical protein
MHNGMECKWTTAAPTCIMSTENIDTCLISETHFIKESFIKFKNYTTYHKIHPANMARGGSTIIIRNNIKHFEEEK